MADIRYSVNVDTAQGVRNLQNLEAQTGKTNSAFSGLQKGLVALGAGAALGGFTLAIRGAMKSVDDLAKSARALGIASDSFQALSRSAQLAGVSSEQLSSTLQRLQVNLGQGLARGSGAAVDAMNTLGLSLREVAALPADQQITRITEALRGVENPAQRSALAVELLGRQGPRMLEVAENMARIKRETEQMGLSLSNVDTRAIEQANDAISELVFILQSVLQKVAAELAPYITAIANAIKNATLEGGNFASVFIKNIIPAIELATKAIIIFATVLISGKLIAALGSIVSSIILITRALTTATTVMGYFNAVAGRNPLVKILGLVLGLAAAFGIVEGVVDPLFKTLNEEAEKLTAELERQQAELDNIASTSGGILPSVEKQRDAVATTVDQYRKMGDEFRKNFDFQTRILNLTEEQKLSAETLNDLQKEYSKTLDTLNEKLEQATSASDQERIRAAIADVTAEYQKQLPIVERLVQARQQALGEQKLLQGIENSTGFIQKLNDGVRDTRLEFEAMNMSKLDREIFGIRNKLEKDLTVQVRSLQKLMTATNAGQIGAEIQRITDATGQAIAQQEELARRSYAHQRTFAFGWKQAFEQYADAATNSAEVAGRIFKKTTQGMEDMIVNFAKTGKFEWKNFVAMMLEELLRAQIQSIFARLLGSVSDSIGNAAGGIAGIGGGAGGVGSGGPLADAFSDIGKSASNPVYVFCVNGMSGGGSTGAANTGGITGGFDVGTMNAKMATGITASMLEPIRQSISAPLEQLLGGSFSTPSRTVAGAAGLSGRIGTSGGSSSGGSSGGGFLGGLSNALGVVGNVLSLFGGGSGASRTSGTSGGGSSGGISLNDPAWDQFLSSGGTSGLGRSPSDWYVDRNAQGGGVAYPLTEAGRRAGEAGFSPLDTFGGMFAKGGMLGAGKWGIAGEAGPELISGPAQITPMGPMGGSTNVTYNINAVDARSFKEMLAQDPGYIYGLTIQGSKGVPSRR